MSTNNIALAIKEVQAERDHLAARLAKVDALIVTMREMFHLPNTDRAPIRKAKPAPVAAPPTNGTSTRTVLTDEMILTALKAGPLKPGVLAKRLGVDRPRVRFRVTGLEQRGFLTSTGATGSRLIQLTAKAAKEAP
jgi:hypothetical protein